MNRSRVFKSSYGNMGVNSSFLGTNSMTQTTMERKKNLQNQFEQNFDPKNYLGVGITERDVELFKEVFDLFDVNGIGCLTPIDIRSALEMFGYHPKKQIVYEIISNIDSDESGGIGFNEFLKIMTDQKRPCDQDVENDYDDVFNYYDCDQKGYVDRDDIRSVAMDLNEPLSDTELDDIMQKLDPSGEGKIVFLNFYKCMQEAIQVKRKKKR